MVRTVLPLFMSLAVTGSLARDVPDNLKALYKQASAQGQCNDVLATGFYSWPSSSDEWTYCADHLSDYGIIYIQGPDGMFSNMDIDCDGVRQDPNNGRCGDNPTDQSTTSFRSRVQGYKVGLEDLDPYRHSFVVFGNSGTKPGYTNFAPMDHGIEPLSVMVAVTAESMVCGIWGDGQGGERNQAFVGEASLAMGELLFGNNVNGTTSHEPNDVMYIAFTGKDAVPGAKGAAWAASTKEEFVSSIDGLCDKLIKRIEASSNETTRRKREGGPEQLRRIG